MTYEDEAGFRVDIELSPASEVLSLVDDETLIGELVKRRVLTEETAAVRSSAIPGESYGTIHGEVRRDLMPGVGVHRFLTKWQPPGVPFRWEF